MTRVADRERSTMDLTVQEFLAHQRKGWRRAGAQLLHRDWRVTSDPVDIDEFWQVFDAAVASDGTVDLAVLSSTPSDGVASFGPAMVQAATAVVGLCLAAAAAGYQVGKEIGEALDDEPTDGGSDGGDDDGGDDDDKRSVAPRSQIVLATRGRVLAMHVTSPDGEPSAGPESTVEDVLADLKRDRRGTMKSLRARPQRAIAGPAFDGAELAALIDAAVEQDGEIDLAAFSGPQNVASLGPLGAAVAAVAGAALLSFAVGVAVGLAVETLGDDAGDDTSDDDTDDGGGGGGTTDTSDTGTRTGRSRSVTGTIRRGKGAEIELRMAR